MLFDVGKISYNFRFVDTDSDSVATLEWKKVSLVVDRVLLLIFFLAMTISSLAILTSSPHIYTSSLSDLRNSGINNQSESDKLYRTGQVECSPPGRKNTFVQP